MVGSLGNLEKRQGHYGTLPSNYHHLSRQSSFKTVPGVTVSPSKLIGFGGEPEIQFMIAWDDVMFGG
ncbi:hypothetical protein N9893_00865 [bacterium]|nr:hypothetical protein [bacterium]